MDQPDTDFHLQCRLCSSKMNLVSLSRGKNKKIRNYIRLIAKTIVGIKFKKNDFFDCICLTCIIQMYNQHIFLVKSIENEERLQSILQKRAPNRKNKHNVKCPQELQLLNTDEVKKAIVQWIICKQEIISSDSSDRSSCESDKILSQETENEIITIVEDERRPHFDVAVQTTCKSIVRHAHSQTPNVLTKETYSQTERQKTKEQFTQYRINVIHTGTQCAISDETAQNGSNQTEMLAKSQFTQYGHINKLKKNCDKFVIVDGKLVKFPSCIHDTLNGDISGKKTTPIKKNINTPPVGLEFGMLTPKSSDISNNDGNKESRGKELQEISIDCHTSETESIKMEQKSPTNMSMNTSIHLKTSPPHSDKSYELESNPLLLEPVEERYLQMCRICEKPFYTKSTFDAHKKGHMKCSLCQKTFKSIKKTTEHYTMCSIFNRAPYIMLERMKLPTNAKNINVPETNGKPTHSGKINDATTIPIIPMKPKNTAKKQTGKSGGKKRKLDQDIEKPSCSMQTNHVTSNH